MAVADPKFVSGPPTREKLEKAKGNVLHEVDVGKYGADTGYTEIVYAPPNTPKAKLKRMAYRQQADSIEGGGIKATGDEALPFQWGPLAAQLAKLGYSAGARQLIKRRLVKDPSGKPQPFYHGTFGDFKGDLNPAKTNLGISTGKPQAWLSTAPETAGFYAFGKYDPYVGGRIFKKYLAPLKGKDPGVVLAPGQLHGGPGEIRAIVSDPRVFVSPHAIAPRSIPNFLPYLAPPAIGSQQ